MSYTRFVDTASLTVVDGFNLESYLDAISERCIKENNFIAVNYGEYEGKVVLDFRSYVRESGGKILIEYDSEECNCDSEVWDWLIDQFMPIMNSKFVEIKSATIDSFSGVDVSGVDVSVSYLGKDGNWINTDDLIKNYINTVTP